MKSSLNAVKSANFFGEKKIFQPVYYVTCVYVCDVHQAPNWKQPTQNYF